MPGRSEKLAELYVDVKARLDRLERQLNDITQDTERKTTEMGRSFRRMQGVANRAFDRIGAGALRVFSNMARWAKRFVAVGVVGTFAAITGAIVKAVSTSARFEQMRLRLQQVTGSIQAGERAFRELVAFSARTPFKLEGLVEAASTLEAFGAESRDVIEAIADMSVYMKTDVVDAASAFGRAFAAGAGAADILREKGILNLVKFKTGIQDLSKMTLPEFRKALIDTLTDPDGRIAGGTAKLADTLLGKWSTTKDNITLIFKGLGDAMRPGLKDALDKVNQEFAKWGEVGWGNITKAIARHWADMLELLVEITLNTLTSLSKSLIAFPHLFMTAILKGEGVIKAFAKSWRFLFEKAIEETIQKSEKSYNEFVDLLKTTAKEYKKIGEETARQFDAGFRGELKTAKTKIKMEAEILPFDLDEEDIFDEIKTAAEAFEDSFQASANVVAENINKTFFGALAESKNIFAQMANAFLTSMTNALIQFLSRLAVARILELFDAPASLVTSILGAETGGTFKGTSTGVKKVASFQGIQEPVSFQVPSAAIHGMPMIVHAGERVNVTPASHAGRESGKLEDIRQAILAQTTVMATMERYVDLRLDQKLRAEGRDLKSVIDKEERIENRAR